MDERTDIWREGKWLDLWSVVHFLSGISIGFGMYLLHLGTLASILLTLVSLVAYEMWEMIVQIQEAPTNRFTDVMFGMLGFLPTLLLLAPQLPTDLLILVSGFVLTTNVVMSIAGWHASQKAAALKQKLRAKLARQRKRFNR
jgi:hypothetical protein